MQPYPALISFFQGTSFALDGSIKSQNAVARPLACFGPTSLCGTFSGLDHFCGVGGFPVQIIAAPAQPQ